MNAFVTHLSFDFRSGLRDRTLLLMNYLFPLGFYFLMGLLMPKMNPLFTDTMIPSLISFTIITSAVLGMPNPLVSSREAGIFRSFKINGVPAVSILSIPAIATLFHTAIVSAIILLTGPSLFGGKLPANWPGFILTYFAAAVSCIGLGLLIGVISQNTRVTVLWSQLIFLPSMLLGGLMLPSAMLPPSLAKISMLLPSTYAMNAFESLGRNGSALFNPAWSVIILFAGGVLAFILSAFLFNWDNNNKSAKSPPILALLALIPYVLGMLFL